jgi:hypothetical protein
MKDVISSLKEKLYNSKIFPLDIGCKIYLTLEYNSIGIQCHKDYYKLNKLLELNDMPVKTYEKHIKESFSGITNFEEIYNILDNHCELNNCLKESNGNEPNYLHFEISIYDTLVRDDYGNIIKQNLQNH